MAPARRPRDPLAEAVLEGAGGCRHRPVLRSDSGGVNPERCPLGRPVKVPGGTVRCWQSRRTSWPVGGVSKAGPGLTLT